MLTTEGLPARATTSELRVVNDGSVAVVWTVRGALDGEGAPAAEVEVLTPVDGHCTTRGERLTGWSSLPLAPGATTSVCIRLAMAGAATGAVTPTVTVDAHAA